MAHRRPAGLQPFPPASLYATLYTPMFLRLLGARIGRRCEISTVSNLNPELLEIGDESFLADGAAVGGLRIHRGIAQVGVNRVGRRTFVGNSAVMPVGASIGDNSLLGVLSTTPPGPALPADGTNWLGSPPFLLPRLQPADSFGENFIFRPTPWMIAQRSATDAFRILFPATVIVLQVQLFILFVENCRWGF